MTKAVIYARFSPRPDAEETDAIKVQLHACREYCRKQNYEVLSEWRDIARSGATLDRPGLQSAIADLKRGYVLVVHFLDRLSRAEIWEWGRLELDIKDKHARYESVMGEGTWGNTPSDRLTRVISFGVHAFIRETNNEHTKQSMLAHQANGRRQSAHGKIVYGWKRDPATIQTEVRGRIIKYPDIVKDQDEQDIINTIVQFYQEGPPNLRAVCHRLEQLGIECRGRKKWHHQLIKRILKRESVI